MKQYWFARRFPLREMRGGMAPIHWKGWLVSCAFLAAMAIGGALGWWLAERGDTIQGVVVFAAVAAVSGVGFIGVAHKMGDHVRTIADYREDRDRAAN